MAGKRLLSDRDKTLNLKERRERDRVKGKNVMLRGELAGDTDFQEEILYSSCPTITSENRSRQQLCPVTRANKTGSCFKGTVHVWRYPSLHNKLFDIIATPSAQIM